MGHLDVRGYDMSGVTAKGFPYPTGSDRVRDGDNAMQALAESVDTYLDGTAWVYPALAPGWSSPAGPGGAQIAYRRDGVGNVHIQGVITAPASGSTIGAWIMPVGFRPPIILVGYATDFTANGWGTCSIWNTGEVGVGPALGHAYWVNAVYNIRGR